MIFSFINIIIIIIISFFSYICVEDEAHFLFAWSKTCSIMLIAATWITDLYVKGTIQHMRLSC